MSRGVVRNAMPDELRYFENELSRPAFERKKELAKEKLAGAMTKKVGLIKKVANAYNMKEEPYVDLDIPTFMRKKAD
jgi:hypothetical protein